MKNIYLTDKQYLAILIAQRQRLDRVARVEMDDCTDTGNKHTESNVGLCDDGLVTKDNSMWPEQFPGRKTMKYMKGRQTCPLDGRRTKKAMGCFFKCRIFNDGLTDIEEIKKLYDQRIRQVQIWQGVIT